MSDFQPEPEQPQTPSEPQEAPSAQPPTSSPNAYAGYAAPPAENAPPSFAKVMVIIDLILCAIRVPLVLLGIVGMQVMDQDSPIYSTAIFEIATGVGIVILGIPAAILLLKRVKLGVILGWLTMAVTACSIFVGGWQAMVTVGAMENEAQRIGGMVGGFISIVIRIALLVMYGVAVKMYSKFIDKAERAEVSAGF